MSGAWWSLFSARWSPGFAALVVTWVFGTMARWMGVRPVFVVYRNGGTDLSIGADLSIAMHRCATELLIDARSMFWERRESLRPWVRVQLDQALWSAHWVQPDWDGLQELVRALGREFCPDTVEHCAELLGLPRGELAPWLKPMAVDDEDTQIMHGVRVLREAGGDDVDGAFLEVTQSDSWLERETDAGR